MGAWGTGPFDNDTAADWCGDLHDADPSDRLQIIRAALAEAADEVDYLDASDAEVAVAAAAVLAAGATPVDSAYAPAFLSEGEQVEGVTPDLVDLALRALDRVVADESEWRALWLDSDQGTAMMSTVQQLRQALSP